MRYAVTCVDYTTPSVKTREGAERLLEIIIAGGECPNDHEIVEVEL